IECRRGPHRRATGRPGFSSPGGRIWRRIQSGRELPGEIARLCVESKQTSLHLEFTAGDANKYFAVHKLRRHGYGIAVTPVHDSLLPDNLTGCGIECDEHRI